MREREGERETQRQTETERETETDRETERNGWRRSLFTVAGIGLH